MKSINQIFGSAAVITFAAFAMGVSIAPAFADEDPLKNVPRVNINEFHKGAISKSLPLLQQSATTFVKQTDGTCFSCHHQTLPSVAVAIARERGFVVDTKIAAQQTGLVYGTLKLLKPLAEKALTSSAAEKDLDMITVDPSISIGYALYGLAAEEVRPDAATTAAVRYLSRKQQSDGRWPVWTARPPLEASEFTTTALAIRAIQTYAPKTTPDEIADNTKRIAKARTWLLTSMPMTTEDRAFKLFGLRWSGASAEAIEWAKKDLLRLQHDDGGWGQSESGASDAYATGQALVALNQAGGVSTEESAYRRGAFFLSVTQKPDGSWLVAKRATGVQRYFESGFPHGNDQFISCAASSWATIALALTQPKNAVTARRTAPTPTATVRLARYSHRSNASRQKVQANVQ